VFVPHKSILDLLDQFPSCALPFEVFLDLLPPLCPRYYTISSSPLVVADTCSITVGVLEAPARSGNGRFKGICSNYLAGSRSAPPCTALNTWGSNLNQAFCKFLEGFL
jgi:cytochrome P450 / NADPH-cytochrome P450 reductase